MKVLKKAGCFLLSMMLLVSFAKKEVKASSEENTENFILEENLNVQLPMSISANHNMTLFIIGDSTSKSYHEKEMKTYPREGWGQEIAHSFKGERQARRQYIYLKKDSNAVQYILPEMNIESWGRSGATIKSSYESNRFSKMLSRVKAKDYVVIQFGHNDARKAWGETPKEYEQYLVSMIKQIKAKKATPILVTSLPQYNKKRVQINAPRYRKKMLKVSKKHKVACIDLNQECVRYFNLRGHKVTKNWYMFLKANKYSSYPKGLKDPTHFTKAGASVAARMVAVQMQNISALNMLTKNINFNSTELYKTLNKAEKYNKRQNYKKKSWKKLKKLRKQGWITLYSPNKSSQDCKQADLRLKRAMKGLKKKK